MTANTKVNLWQSPGIFATIIAGMVLLLVQPAHAQPVDLPPGWSAVATPDGRIALAIPGSQYAAAIGILQTRDVGAAVDAISARPAGAAVVEKIVPGVTQPDGSIAGGAMLNNKDGTYGSRVVIAAALPNGTTALLEMIVKNAMTDNDPAPQQQLVRMFAQLRQGRTLPVVRLAAAQRLASAPGTVPPQLPPARRPLFAFLQTTQSMGGFPMMLQVTNKPWFLLPGGIAVSCTIAEPATLVLDIKVIDAMDTCSAASWRRIGNRTEIKYGPELSWTNISDLITPPNIPAGLRLDLSFGNISSQGASAGIGLASVSVLTTGQLYFARDGQFASGSNTSTSASASPVTTYNRSSTGGLAGRYHLDGFVLTVQQADGSFAHRYVLLQKYQGAYKYFYFEGQLYSD
jgi:hypothetical protein